VPLKNVKKYELRQIFVDNAVNGTTQNLKKEVDAPHETAPTLDNGQCQMKHV